MGKAAASRLYTHLVDARERKEVVVAEEFAGAVKHLAPAARGLRDKINVKKISKTNMAMNRAVRRLLSFEGLVGWAG